MNLGCHACLFGERIKTETDFILENLNLTGFKGVEIGFRFFGEDVLRLTEALRKNQMTLSGFHCAIKFSELSDKPDETSDFLLNIGNLIKTMPDDIFPTKNLVMSSDYECDPPRSQIQTNSRLNDEGFLKECSKNLDIITKNLSAQGVRLNYHNHNQEFEQNQKIFNILRQYVNKMFFAFDIGWVSFGGSDVLQTLKDNKDKISYIHLRDINKGEGDFVPLGTGDFNYSHIVDLLNEIIPPEGWAIVEYETGEQDFDRYKQAKQFLNSFNI